MAQEYIKLHFAQDYFQARVKELRRQVPDGNPFLFLGAVAVLNSVLLHAGRSIERSLPPEYKPEVSKLIREMSEQVGWLFFSRDSETPEQALAFTHEDVLHLQEAQSDGRVYYVLSATKFLDTVSQVIDNLFKEAEGNDLLAMKMFVSINERRLFGHGK